MADISDRNINRLASQGLRDDVINTVVSEIKQSETTLASWKQRIVKFYELYKMVQSKKHYDGLASIFVPEILRAVETVVGNLYKILTGNMPFFEFEGREDSDEPSARAMTQLTMYQMEENNFKAKLMDSLRQMVITGLTVRKVLWDFQQVARTSKEMEKELQIDQLTGKENVNRVYKKKVTLDTIKDHWTFDPVDLLSFHISDINTPYNDIQKARWIAEQYLVDRQWVVERIKKGWLTKYELSELDGKAPDSDYARMNASRTQSSGFTLPAENNGKIEIIERWGLCPAFWLYTSEELQAQGLEPDDQVESVIVIANRRCILKLEPNPFWHNEKPYVSCPYVPQEFEFTGIGIAQIGEKLQEELNDTRNQTMDNKTLILMCMWLKSRNSGINNKDLRVRPLGVIATNDMNGLEALRPPVLTGTGVNIEGVIKEDLRQSVGASSNLQGIAQQGVDTATESSLINKESFGRLLLTAQLFGELVMKPLLIKVQYLNYQFYDHVRAIKIIGPTGVHFRKMAPNELVGNKDVVVKINTDVDDNPTVKRQQQSQFLTVVQGMDPAMIQFHWKLLDKIYRSLFDNRSLSEVYQAPPDEEELLSPEQELDLILAEYPVQAKMRQDLMQHIDALVMLFDNVGFGLTEAQFSIFKNLIMQYEALRAAQMEAMQMEFQAQLEMVRSKGMNTGQVPNGNAHNQTKTPPNEGGIRREMGV